MTIFDQRGWTVGAVITNGVQVETFEAKCDNCYWTGPCYFDGEANVCVNFDMCKKNERVNALAAACFVALQRIESDISDKCSEAMQLRAALAPHWSDPAAPRRRP